MKKFIISLLLILCYICTVIGLAVYGINHSDVRYLAAAGGVIILTVAIVGAKAITL